jgi:EpsI family protein
MKPNYKLWAIGVFAILAVQALVPVLSGAASKATGALPLKDLPREIRGWRLAEEMQFGADILGALAPDDYLARLYNRDRDQKGGELLVAYFRTQSEGFGPHSPKVCLPASGWDPVEQTVVNVSDGKGGMFPANHFVIQNGERKSVVLYWYHTAERVSVGEIEARLWLAWDSLMFRGTDIALVRLIVPFAGSNAQDATEAARDMGTVVHENLKRVWSPS